MGKEWLVETRLKDWAPMFQGENRIVAYEEVIAGDEVSARHIGFHQFELRAKYEPILRRKLKQAGISHGYCCAPDAVQIE